MKTRLICASIAAVLATAAAYAQSSPVLEANVPFTFVVGGKTMAAGAYTVRSTPSGVIEIRSADGKDGVMSLATLMGETSGPNKVRLVFHRYENTYILAEIWGPNDCRQLPRTGRERELASRSARSSTYIVAALR